MTRYIGLRPAEKYLEILAIAGICLLFIGFLFNRVVSNTGFLLIGVYTLYKLDEIRWLFRDKWMITFICLACLPLFSDIILEGFGFVKQRGVMKLLLILFPAFIFAFQPQKKVLSYLIYSILFFMLMSSVYSLFHYFSDFENMAGIYKVSKVMPVLSFRDHIRISWVTVMSCLLAFYEIRRRKSKSITWILSIYIIFQVIFVHLLGSKTGLLSLYVTMILLCIYLLKGRARWALLIILPSIMLLPFIAYKLVPSIQQRFNFIKYDFELYSKGEYKPGLSDAVRYYSLMAGKDIIASNPVFGTGFSRLKKETAQWYKDHVPEMTSENYFIPSSEIVIYWASAGIAGLIVFLLHLFVPFFYPYLWKNVWFMSFFIPAAISFTFETHLEGQLPLFAYGFFISLFWYLAWMDHKEMRGESE